MIKLARMPQVTGQCMFGPKTAADEEALTGMSEISVSTRSRKSSTLTMAYIRTDENGLDLYAAVSDEDNRIINKQKIIVTSIKSGKGKRSGLQNSAMHLYFTMLSDALNNAGLDMVAVLEKLFHEPSLQWSPLAVKERLWKGVQKHSYGTKSTTELETDQVRVVYEALNVATTQYLGVGVNFPERLMQMYEQDLESGR